MELLDVETTSYAHLPAELLQVVGSRLSSEQLRNARLVCAPWATALAHCMPAVTVALPRQASERIFRQPLVLCSSGVLNSAQCQDYSAVPRGSPHNPNGSSSCHVLGRHRSCRHSHDGISPGCSSSCKRACTGSTCSITTSTSHEVSARSLTEPGTSSFPAGPCDSLAPAQDATDAAVAEEAAQPVSRDKPSPFATEMGQAVLDCLLEDPLLTAAARGSAEAVKGSRATAAAGSGIPRLPRMGAIKAAISMPPTLAEQAAATQQRHAMQAEQQQMRKLSSVPASNAHPVPRTRHVSKQAGLGATFEQQQPGTPQHHVVTAMGPALQGWSSLPTAGLRTCSSLKQLNLKLSGAPPSPADLLDLSKLLHLTHLSFKQVDLPDTDDLMPSAVEEDSAEMLSSSTYTSRSSSSMLEPGALQPPAAPAPPPASDVVGAGTSSKGVSWVPCPGPASAAVSGLKRSHSIGPARLQHSGDMAAAASALEGCHIGSAAVLPRLQSTKSAGHLGAGSLPSDCADSRDVRVTDSEGRSSDDAAAAPRDQGFAAPQNLTCSVISAEHVKSLAQLPYLSSLELAPKQGVWDAVSREGLLHLVDLTRLTRLSITWGDAAAAMAPLGADEAVAAAQGEHLELQKCLAGMTNLHELCINGAAVVDVAVLQRLQQLRTLTGEGLQVVNSDVMALIDTGEEQERLEQQSAQQQHGSAAGAAGQQLHMQPVLGAGGAAGAGAASAANAGPQQQVGRWASLPNLLSVHAVHPASDISLLLQSTLTPQLSHLGFVTRGPSDFARLLGQHGKLRTLHLAFTEEEPWHPIAVVRLPTALPSLTSLTINSSFWLPNSLIVALGVMEVPLEHLSLTCKLAPACLQRLQHLKRLKRLALHHVPSAASGKGGKGGNDAMLQLPAKLLPPQLQELEISNGWILH